MSNMPQTERAAETVSAPKLLLIAGLLGATFYDTFLWLLDRWGYHGSYYSHGYLVAPLAAYLLWRKREALSRCRYVPSGLGVPLICLGLFVHLVGGLWRIKFTSGLSMIVVLWGTTLALYGKEVGRKALFPILFLAWMVPVPMAAVAHLSLRMKLFAARCAMEVMEFMSVVAVQDGSRIQFQNGSIVVGDVCSGLRSLIALLAFGALFGYVCSGTRTKRLILFASSVPFALIANICRILILCLVTYFWSSEAATGWVHDGTGVLIFAIAFVLLFSLERVLDVLLGRDGEPRPAIAGGVSG